MSTELKTTLGFVVVAVVLTGAAVWRSPATFDPAAVFDDQGEPFFPNFTDPLECTSLEVIDYDPDTATAVPFKVMLQDGRWAIPSHHDYPADAEDRLARTASGVMDLTKDTVRSDRAEDHEVMGVLDPLDPKVTTLRGRGKRVTLRNASDQVLADFIIGNEVPGDRGQRYVRVPGQKRTYGVNVTVDLSTNFADWIETNLLRLESPRIRRIVFDNHRVDPERRQVIPGEVLRIERETSTDPWTLVGSEDEELNTQTLSRLTSALSDLRIVGVRPKPPGLTHDLRTSDEEGISLTPESILSLQSRGFHVTRNGDLLSNNGEVRVATDEGIVYTLRFGEVVFARGEALTAGTDTGTEEPSGEESPSPGPGGDAGGQDGVESRYLFATVHFDPSLIPPPPDDDPPLPSELPDNVFETDPDDPDKQARAEAVRQKTERREQDRQRQMEAGQNRADELTDRFADWYYLIPGDSFRTIALDRAALTQPPAPGPDLAPDTLPPDFPIPGHFEPGRFEP